MASDGRPCNGARRSLSSRNRAHRRAREARPRPYSSDGQSPGRKRGAARATRSRAEGAQGNVPDPRAMLSYDLRRRGGEGRHYVAADEGQAFARLVEADVAPLDGRSEKERGPIGKL